MTIFTSATRLTVLGLSTGLLMSCAATQTVLEHGKLSTDTKLSKTIFLDPVPSNQKSVFIAVKNTSQEQLDFSKPLARALKAQGYQVMTSPERAHYLLQANILKVGKMSQSASQTALGGGFGSALAGAGTGAALGALTDSGHNVLVGGLAGGVVGLAADSLIKNVNYTVVADIQLSERVGKGVKVSEQFNSSLDNGSSSGTVQTSTRDSQFMRYRTRVVSTANKVNLSFNEARPVLEQGLVKTLSGLF